MIEETDILELKRQVTELNDSLRHNTMNQLSIGDLTIVSRTPLKSCCKTAKNLLKNQSIKDYLELTKVKKLGAPSYIE